MHTDVASSSIKFRAINNPVFAMIHPRSLDRAERKGDRRIQKEKDKKRERGGEGWVIRINYGESMS